jgi:hypothetical protein
MSDDDSFASADELVIGGPGSPRRRRRWWIGGLALCVAGAGAGAAAWAAVSFFGTGAQPAEALPDSTLGYVGLDLDPSGGQKIEALKLARKFPALKEKVGLDSDDGLRKWVVEELAKDSGCTTDFEKDVEPWLGSRAAVAAVPLDGHDDPALVGVLQITDEDAAEKGLTALDACGKDDGQATEVAWTVSGDWVVLADSKEQADRVVAATGKGSLADDGDFADWMDRVGDSGLMTAYAAPAAGRYFADQLDKEMSDATGDSTLSGCKAYADKARSALSEFEGAAATLRLRDGGAEVGAVASSGLTAVAGLGIAQARPAGTPAVTTLPSDTAVAYGLAMPQDWAATMEKQFKAACGDDFGGQELFGPMADVLGFDLLKDGPKVIGDSVAVAVGPDFDVESLVNSGDPSGLPLAVKTTGDKDVVDDLLGSLTAKVGMPDGLLTTGGEDGAVAIAFDGDYAKKVAADGGLGKDETFRDVVPHAGESSAVVYVDFDQLDDAIAQMASGDEEVVDNLKPLKAAGFSVWNEKDELHALLRVSLD